MCRPPDSSGAHSGKECVRAQLTSSVFSDETPPAPSCHPFLEGCPLGAVQGWLDGTGTAHARVQADTQRLASEPVQSAGLQNK